MHRACGFARAPSTHARVDPHQAASWAGGDVGQTNGRNARSGNCAWKSPAFQRLRLRGTPRRTRGSAPGTPLGAPQPSCGRAAVACASGERACAAGAAAAPRPLRELAGTCRLPSLSMASVARRRKRPSASRSRRLSIGSGVSASSSRSAHRSSKRDRFLESSLLFERRVQSNHGKVRGFPSSMSRSELRPGHSSHLRTSSFLRAVGEEVADPIQQCRLIEHRLRRVPALPERASPPSERRRPSSRCSSRGAA